MPRTVLIPIAALVMLAIAGCGDDREEVTPDATTVEASKTPPPSVITTSPIASGTTGKYFGYINVSITIPEDLGIQATTYQLLPAREWEGQAIQISRDRDPSNPGGNSSYVTIDANTGDIVEERVSAADRADMDTVLRTLQVQALDRDNAPWPYSGQPPEDRRDRFGQLSFINPAPEARMHVYHIGSGDGQSGIGLQTGNATLAVTVDGSTNELVWDFAGRESDRDVLEGWLATVSVCSGDSSC